MSFLTCDTCGRVIMCEGHASVAVLDHVDRCNPPDYRQRGRDAYERRKAETR